ncbi:unnamed protein product [Allacma fusca]|uniref:Integrase catalytic domain-containing protein n=1 Tax=Allacma fusca TaxID=39272 RepID=A0A8J2PL31_9HEXA|nr:unnamed protein product [Allacma fusca]
MATLHKQLKDEMPPEQSRLRTPKVYVPLFSGHHNLWPTFKSEFRTLVANSNLYSASEKMRLLVEALAAGDAKDMLADLQVTDGNWEVCWARVQDRYDSPRETAHAAIRPLLDLPPLMSQSEKGLHKLINTVRTTRAQLGQIDLHGVTPEEVLYLHFVMSKLDQKTISEFQDELSDNHVPSLERCIGFLAKKAKNIGLTKEIKFNSCSPATVSFAPRSRKDKDVDDKASRKVFTMTSDSDTSREPSADRSRQRSKKKTKRVVISRKRSTSVCGITKPRRSQVRSHSGSSGASVNIAQTQRRRSFPVSKNMAPPCSYCGNDRTALLNCLGSHTVKECSSLRKCLICQSRHNTLLHNDGTKRFSGFVNVISLGRSKEQTAVMPTAIVNIQTQRGCKPVRCLLDSGSQACFITADIFKELRLPMQPYADSFVAAGNQPINVLGVVTFTIRSTVVKSWSHIIEAYVLQEITSNVPRCAFDISNWNHIDNLNLADAQFNKPGPIHVLFGITRFDKCLLTGPVKKHQDYFHIIWRAKPNQPVSMYRMKIVPFGVCASPFIACRTLQQLATDEVMKFPMAAEIVKKHFYMDDLMFSIDSVDQALEAQHQLIGMLKTANFELRKWSSNFAELLEAIPIELRETQLPLRTDDTSTIKTLGITWNPATDVFTFKVILDLLKHHTKRTVLSDISKMYDPIGWLGPVIVTAKILMQTLWTRNLNWDDPLHDDILSYWLDFAISLVQLEKITVPRYLGYHPYRLLQLHGFSDASAKAYSAVIYLRIESNGKIVCQLVTAKTRVSPLKTLTLPRLELQGAVLLAELMHHIMTVWKLPFESRHYWTDSEIVLHWLTASPTKWKTFVSNRVSQIQNLSNNNQWHHVSSENNPADVASRGIKPGDLIDYKLWWHGPEWLKDPDYEIPEWVPHSSLPDDEQKSTALLIQKDDTSILQELCRISSWKKAIHVLAIIIQVGRVKSFQIKKIGELKPSELLHAENQLVRLIQHDVYEKIIVAVQAKDWSSKQFKEFRCLATARQQIMAQLPAFRVKTLSRPFVHTGVDLAGPYHLKNFTGNRGGRFKVWICLFTCMASRAVHLELVSSMSYQGVLLAFRRFIARRGLPSNMYSDNGTNFVGASNFLSGIVNSLNEEQKRILPDIPLETIIWCFSPPRAPHHGGVWEACVKLVKNYLRKL